MAIWNMLARLTMDSTAFDRNTSKARKSFRDLAEESTRTQKQFLGFAKGAVGLAAIGAAAYAAKRAFTSITDAAGAQDAAVRKLTAAYALTNDATTQNITVSRAFAEEIQNRTTLSDEMVLTEMAYGKTLGLSVEQIGKATIAAVGLTTQDISLHEAMKIVALAAKGETGQLKERGIILDKGTSKQEQFDDSLRQCAEKFKLAEAATKGASGAQAQYQNALQDTKAVLGEALLPTMTSFFTRMKTMLEDNKGAIKKWADDTVEGLEMVGQAFGAVEGNMSIRQRYDRLFPSYQKSLSEAVLSEKGQQFGYAKGGKSSVFIFPTKDNQEYIVRMIEAYERNQKKKLAGQGNTEGASTIGEMTSASGETATSAALNSDAVTNYIQRLKDE